VRQAVKSEDSAFGGGSSDAAAHFGSAGGSSSNSLGASAFTGGGSSPSFSAGSFSPSAGGGDQLLGHEVAHVVQQGGGSPYAGMY